MASRDQRYERKWSDEEPARWVISNNVIVPSSSKPCSLSEPCPVCRETHFGPEKNRTLARRPSREILARIDEEDKKRLTRLREVYTYPPREDPWPEMETFTFASDAEREEVVQRLRAAGAEGRLTPEALEHRVAQAIRTCTREGLPALLEGLPSESSLVKRPKIMPSANECPKTAEEEADELIVDVILVLVAIGCVMAVVLGIICGLHAVFG